MKNKIDQQKLRSLKNIEKNNGFIYKQLKRNATHAIYEQMYDLESEPIGYEVIKIQIKGGNVFNGKLIPPYERFPEKSSWGSQGWTYYKKEGALAKYNSLVAKEKKADQDLSNQIQKKVA